MFDLGMTELLVIGIVALIVVGPKDLPVMFRTLGRFTGKLRGMAREFQRAMNDAADESGMRDVGKDLRKMTSPKSMGLDRIKDAADRFEKWEPGLNRDVKTPSSSEMTEERAEDARKIRESAAQRAQKRLDAEARARDAAEGETPATDRAESRAPAKGAAKGTGESSVAARPGPDGASRNEGRTKAGAKAGAEAARGGKSPRKRASGQPGGSKE